MTENIMCEIYSKTVALEKLVDQMNIHSDSKAELLFELNRWVSFVEDEMDNAVNRRELV